MPKVTILRLFFLFALLKRRIELQLSASFVLSILSAFLVGQGRVQTSNVRATAGGGRLIFSFFSSFAQRQTAQKAADDVNRRLKSASLVCLFGTVQREHKLEYSSPRLLPKRKCDRKRRKKGRILACFLVEYFRCLKYYEPPQSGQQLERFFFLHILRLRTHKFSQCRRRTRRRASRDDAQKRALHHRRRRRRRQR